MLLLASNVGYGHGYIDISRGKLCKDGLNSSCGSIVWEPQSLEGPDRFPDSGPADGTLASAGVGRFSALDEQSPTRWHKTPITSGPYTFNWNFTAVHRTRDWRYFITQPNWNSSQPLSRAAFDTTPFCTHNGGNAVPPTSVSHDCVIPDRNGYHVILAVWDVGDTSNSFYNVLDVEMTGGGTVSQWVDIGDINPSTDLSTGDSVLVRLFDDQGELFARNIEMEILSDSDGQMNVWPKLAAEYVSAEAPDLAAGIRNEDDEVIPSFGRNDLFAERNSAIIRAEVELIEGGVGLPPEISVSVDDTEFQEGMAFDLNVTVTTNQLLEVSANLFKQNVSIGLANANIQGTDTLTLSVANPEAGDYQLIVTGRRSGDGALDQQTIGISVVEVGTSQYNYPQGRGSYGAGTLVTGTDGNIYACQIPNWCNGFPTYYAPGTGLAWSSAWTLVGTGTPPPPPSQADYVYPDGRGQYQSGTLVQGGTGKIYRCNIAGWCNSSSELYYAPGTGLAWDSAWSEL